MPKVEFHTEQNERFKMMLNAIVEKYGAYLNIKQISEATGINKWTLYELLNSGKIRHTRSSGDHGNFIISSYDVVKYLEQNAEGGEKV
jgi:excisionase family DNA binding protein